MNNVQLFPQQPYPGAAPNQMIYTYPYQTTTSIAPTVAPVTPAQPLVTGSLDDFFSQPSVSGGPSWSFKDKPLGTTYVGVVARAITNADIQQQTTPGTGQPATYRDGRPKWVMRVPLVVAMDPSYPDGEATWYVTGQSRDELVRAMREAGAPDGPPEAGAKIQVTLTARKPSRTPGFNPSNQVSVRYESPAVEKAEPRSDAAPTVTPVAPAAPSVSPNLVPPGDLTPEQQALLARLTGQVAA